VPTNGRYAYLDTSALVKLCWPEPESEALRTFLRDWPNRVSAALLWTEALRASHRRSTPRVQQTLRALQRMPTVEIDRALFRQAGLLGPSAMRSLDAVHIAAAMSLGSDLGVVVTYDERMIAAAELFGLSVEHPS
jgi:predicted nucleic acid-binding protein